MILAICLLSALVAVVGLRFQRKKLGIALLAAALIGFWGAGSGILPAILLNRLQIHDPLTAPAWGKVNAIVLLGGGNVEWRSKPGGQVVPSIFASPRLVEAARLYRVCKAQSAKCAILASGGDPLRLGVSEADAFRQALVAMGVTEADILLESKSKNTYQNAQFSSEMLSSGKFDSVVLVTSGIHLRRSLQYFANFGIEATGAPADTLCVSRSWIPLSYNLLLTDLALHEYAGVLRFKIYERMGWNSKSSAPGAL